jgi:hypothetical protein
MWMGGAISSSPLAASAAAGAEPGAATAWIFNVLPYGAKGDGKTLNTKSMQAAVDGLREAGRRSGVCAARGIPDGDHRSPQQCHTAPGAGSADSRR